MWYVIGICFALLFSVVVGLSKNKTEANSKSTSIIHAVTAATITDLTPETLMSLSVTQVNILLSRLEKEDPPVITMGAMCYEMMAAPVVAEYICPVCGEKTIYSYSQSAFLEWELEGCRRMTESINSHTDFEVNLDETLFCDFCSPNFSEEEPVMLLRINYPNGTEIVNTIYVIDLMKLDSFLQGNLFYIDSTEGHIPLQDSAERMRELLGFEKE